MSPHGYLHLAIALEGAGWHPAAWRTPDARPTELLTPGYWTDVVGRADRAGIDLVTIEDSLALEPNGNAFPAAQARTDRVRGRLDAVLIAARVAPVTRYTGLVPTVTATHTEPFHLSKAIATLDYVSGGRAGVRIQVSGRDHESAHFGRRELERAELMDEAADYVEVVRRLWDSWEDDAEIRDAATGRFIDRDRLHYIDFEGRFFNVKGPSITPRPPQGQPVVVALAHAEPATSFATAQADIVLVTPADTADAAEQAEAVRRSWEEAERRPQPLHVWGDLVVHLAPTDDEATARREQLDEWAGGVTRSDAAVFAGTPDGLADLITTWVDAGLTGIRLRPATIPHDLDLITEAVVPRLVARGRVPADPAPGTLRNRLGLTRPANRYAHR